MLSQLTLDRNGEVALYRQLRAAIEMAIIDGELTDGSALPSVRRLASNLNVAPITVVQAYRDLQSEDLIRSVPKRGYFVSVHPVLDPPAADLARIHSLIDNAIKASTDAGLDSAQFMRMAFERVRRQKPGGRLVAVIGQRHAALPERVSVIAQSVADLDIEVIGLAFEDLEAEPFDPAEMSWADAEIFLAPVGEVQRAANLLGNRGSRILPMTRTIRNDVRDFIQQQPETILFGIIAGSDEFAERILAVMRRLHPLTIPPIWSVIDDADGVQRTIDQANVIVIGSLAHPRLTDFLPLPKPNIEFVSIPDDRTLQKLRRQLIG